jgi:cell wall assembly regulator SMI1
VTDTGADVSEDVRRAWARIEASLSHVLPASLRQLNPPADAGAIDAVQAALTVVLPEDFRASLAVHNGTSGQPSPVPLNGLYDTDRIVAMTRMWRDSYGLEPGWDEPGVWAHLAENGMISLNGPVRPIVGGPGAVVVGDMNADVWWFLDLDPAPGGTPGQVVRVDVECAQWDVLAPSWTQLLLRYAGDLELLTTAPDRSTLQIDADRGPACEWGSTLTPSGIRPEWLRDVQAINPYT